MIRKLLLLAVLCLLPASAWAVDTYYVSSGINSNGVAAGLDTNDGSENAPFATIQKCFSMFYPTGAGKTCIVRQGDYDTVNGWSDGTNLLVPSGTSWNAPFTVQKYSGDANPVHVIRGMRPGAAHTVAQMQGATCSSAISGETNVPCVGAPTKAECAVKGYSQYPSSGNQGCWAGAPGDPSLWAMQDRSGDLMFEAVIEGYNVNYDFGHIVRYVILDGLVVDARGIQQNVFRSTIMNDYRLTWRYIFWKNGEWKNSAASCSAQPGTGSGSRSDYDETGTTPQGNQYYFENFKIHHCGIPFDSYIIPNTTQLARENDNMHFLHGWYFHYGENFCGKTPFGQIVVGCETYNSAGNGAGADGANQIFNSYIHDNTGGHTVSGTTLIQSTIFYNNGNADINGRFALSVFKNNTHVAGPRSQFAITLGDNYYGNTFESNIIEGYPTGIQNYACQWNGSSCNLEASFFPRNVLRNNLIRTNPPGREFTSDNGDVAPIGSCSVGNNICNQNPLFVNAGALNFALTTNSPARGAAYSADCPTTDYTGASRNSPCDIGAFEFGSGGAQPLNTVIDSGPSSQTTSTGGSFSFHGTGGTPPYTYECKLDTGSFASCTSAKSYTSLALGNHTFSVRATDSTPLVDSTPATYTWSIQTAVPPDTVIDTQPISPTTSTVATFTFHGTGCSGSCTYTCSIDAAAYLSCTSPANYSGLAVGDHTFSVRASDDTGMVDLSPATFSWVVQQSGSGTFSVGHCIQVLVGSLNIRQTWPDNSGATIGGTQGFPATGIIVDVDATLNSGGFSGIRTNFTTPSPPNDLAMTAPLDGWTSVNPLNITEVVCATPVQAPSTTVKLGSGGTLKLGAGTTVTVR